VIQFSGPHYKPRLTPYYSGIDHGIPDLNGASLPRHHLKTTQQLSMPFPYLEAGGSLLHAIPQNTVNHSRYLSGDSRGAVYATGIQGADTRAQEPEKPPNVIGMGMAQEYVGNLVGHPGRHTPGITQIEQQAATLVQQLHLQQGITENPVDHTGRHISDPDGGNRTGVTNLAKPRCFRNKTRGG
jgi:hypothetical protein